MTGISSLPNHFGLGLRSTLNELSWMTSSGVPWNYRYQYLNVGWKDWVGPAGSGNFVVNYTNDSINNGYIPVYDLYILAGSSPNIFTNLASTSYMAAYYADFALLMQKITSTGKNPVIVHVEPDLWGFMQQVYGDNPADIPVSVASSGYTGLSGLPNNAIGFTRALVQIKDSYDSSIVLAWHVNTWAANNGYTPTLANPAGYQTPETTGDRIATFYNALGASFDLMFCEASDRDSGFAVVVCGTPSADAWWTDAAFVSFRTFIGRIHSGTGRYFMMWQTPEGNTLYRTCNNTNFHYQDNRPEYFLLAANTQHIRDYISSGVIGIMFGVGQLSPYSQCDSSKSGSSHIDYAADGITNPASITGNNIVSAYPDDDGGFIRLAAADYYVAPIPLGLAIPVGSGTYCCFSSSPNIGAHEYWVAPTGSDSYPGTQSLPFASISYAASIVGPGDTVHVAPGSYAGGFITTRSGTAAARIRFVSDTKWGAKINSNPASHWAGWESRGAYVDIEGFEIAAAGMVWRIGLYLTGSYNVAKNNYVHDIINGTCDSAGGAGIQNDHFYGGTNIDIINNVVANIGPSTSCNTVQGIYIATSGKIYNNLVYRVSGWGITTWHDATDSEIFNNTIFNCISGGISVGTGQYYTLDSSLIGRFHVVNNIAYGNAGYGINDFGDIGNDSYAKNNMAFANGTANYALDQVTTSGNLTANPSFVKYIAAGGGDYHLKTVSVAIDAGLSAGAPAFDLDGIIRPLGAGIDIGAYEQ